MHYGDIPDEYHIHHKNGDPLDNRISNLKLVSPKKHAIEHEIWNNLRGELQAYRYKHTPFDEKPIPYNLVVIYATF